MNPNHLSTMPTPSAWVMRFAKQWPAGSSVLDLACGSGRHVKALAQMGLQVTGVDKDHQALQGLSTVAETVVVDLEDGSPWPLGNRQFNAVIVTNYLWRPLWPAILGCVAPNGWLVYETFAQGHETIGRPARADFLLQPGELLQITNQPDWTVLAYEHGLEHTPHRYVQRIAAVRSTGLPPPLA